MCVILIVSDAWEQYKAEAENDRNELEAQLQLEQSRARTTKSELGSQNHDLQSRVSHLVSENEVRSIQHFRSAAKFGFHVYGHAAGPSHCDPCELRMHDRSMSAALQDLRKELSALKSQHHTLQEDHREVRIRLQSTEQSACDLRCLLMMNNRCSRCLRPADADKVARMHSR